MSSPCEDSAHPKVFYSVADLTDMLDQAQAADVGVPVAPAVKVVDLPDRPTPRRKTQTMPIAKAAPANAAPWWLNAGPDVVLVEPPKSAEPPIVVPTSRPALASFINWKLVGTAGGLASICLMLMVLSALAAQGGSEVAAAQPILIKQTPTPVAQFPAPPQPMPIVDLAAPKQFLPEARIVEQLDKEYAVKAARLDAALALLEKKNEPPAKAEKCAECEKPNKGSYGTAIEFISNPIEAAEQALANKKLMLVLTISGNFEDSKFT
jgi:hypothetical protein